MMRILKEKWTNHSLFSWVFLSLMGSFSSALVFLTLVLFYSDYQKSKKFEEDVIREQILLVVGALENSRITGRFNYISKTLWTLDLIDKVVLFDKNCRILSKIPLNARVPDQCWGETPGGWIFYQVRDDFSQLQVIAVKPSEDKKFFHSDSISAIVLTIFSFSVLFTLISVFFIRRFVTLPFRKIVQLIHGMSEEGEENRALPNPECPVEMRPIYQALFETKKELSQTKGKLLRQREIEVIHQISSQVAHDIRSPLSVLEMTAGNMVDIPPKARQLILGAVGRIKDIANQLLIKNKDGSSSGQIPVPCRPRGLIEEVVAEKRWEYLTHEGLTLETHFGPSSFDLFALLIPGEMRRILSNLLNNAVEAVSRKGKIQIHLQVGEGDFCLTIEDNGQGIPPDILGQLMTRGMSFGKIHGNGLGLSHAKEWIERWQGKILLDSQWGKGTKITMILPRQHPPARWREELEVVHIEDDPYLRKCWETAAHLKKIKIHSFSCGEDFLLEPKPFSPQTLFYLDWHLGQGKLSGEDFGRILYEKGHRHIYLTTGHAPSELPRDLYWSKGILDKRPPWD